MIKDFFESIFGEQSGNVTLALRAAGGPNMPINISQWFSYPREVEKMVAYAESHRDQDVYFSPLVYGNKTNAKGKLARSPENALTSNVIYMDADTAQPSDYRFPPSVNVMTSSGRWHCYWLLTQTISSYEASELVRRITYAHRDKGSDQSSWMENKLLRVPGSVNTSHGFSEEVKVWYTGELYDFNDISGGYDDIEVPERAKLVMGHAEVHTDIEQPEHLPPYAQVIQKLPEKILDLATSEPAANADRSSLRWKLLGRIFAETELTFDEALSVAWNSPASRKWSVEDPRGINGLIAEAAKSKLETDEAKGVETTEEVAVTQHMEHPAVSLLSDDERAMVSTDVNFITRYTQHAKTRLAKQNLPYDRINAWTLLSLFFSSVGYIPRKNGPEYCNIYTMTLGDTTTGKSQSLKLMFVYLNEIFREDQGFNIGGNGTSSALGKKLLERDGRVSFFNRDEAHGIMKTWLTQDYTTGMMEDLALLYDGSVPPMLRTGNWDQSGKTAQTFFTMHLMGTTENITKLITKEMFKSGFLARFQWAIGLPRELDYDAMAERDSDGTEVKEGFDPMARQYAYELQASKNRVTTNETGMVPIFIADDAAERLQEAKWQLTHLFENDPNWDILEPSLVRMGVTVRKAASLLAMSEGLKVTSRRHVVLALEAAEEWVENLLTVSRKVTASDWSRALSDIEEFVKASGGEVPIFKLHRRFDMWETYDIEKYLAGLVKQQRVHEKNNKIILTAKKEE